MNKVFTYIYRIFSIFLDFLLQLFVLDPAKKPFVILRFFFFFSNNKFSGSENTLIV